MQKKQTLGQSFLQALAATMILFSMASVQAQEDDKAEKKSEQEVQKTGSKKKFEKVSVVGSRIRRTDFEGPTPVKVIGRKELEDSPYNSVGDYFRDMTVSAFGSRRETSGSTVGGTSAINIRGIGSTNTLVLLNGTRLQPNGILGNVDLNLIPQIAVESSEILKSGASAIYGSDALGGVVNLNTRRDFTGVEAATKIVLPFKEGGERYQLSVIGGKQFKNSSLTAAFEYRTNKYIMAKDREWSKAGPGGKNGWADRGITPTYQKTDGKWAMRPEDVAACQADPENQFYTVEDGNQICYYAYANDASNIPEIEQYSTYVNYNWDINSRTKLDLVAMVSNQITESIFAPTPAVLEVSKAGVSAWGAFDATQLASMPDPVKIRYRLKEGGNRITEIQSMAYNAVANLEREFGETWTYSLNLGYGFTDTRNESPSGYFNGKILEEVLTSGEFNPYDPNRSKADLGAAPILPYQLTDSITYSVDSSVSGELFELPSGAPVSLATGVQYNHFYYSTESDPITAQGLNTGSAGSNGGGNRDIGSVYAEFVSPLTAQIEAQVATRFDWFSDYGTALSPMAALKYKPLDNMMFRGSVAKGYKAPLMQELYAVGGNGYPFVIDQVACDENRSPDNPYCSPRQYLTFSEAPRDLDAEEAITYNLGMVYEPVRGLSIVIDGWYADISNVIGVSLEQITQAQLEDRKNGNTANEDILNQNGITIERDADDKIAKISVPTQNLSTRRQGGVDIEVSYAFSTKIGKFRISDEHSQTFIYEQESFGGLPTLDLLDRNGVPKWRNNIALSYSPVRNHIFKLDYKLIAGQMTANRFGRLDTYGEVDFTYITRLPWSAEFKVGVKNIFQDTPPYDEYVGMDSSLYNDWGSYAFLNYRQNF